MAPKLTISKIIEECKIVHSNKYDYTKTLQFEGYKNNRTKIPITCRKHGDFTQSVKDHKKGKEGCKHCRTQKSREKQALTTQEFINRARKIHDNTYNYEFVVYINNNTPVTIECHKHGPFLQLPKNHINEKAGCDKCSREISGKKRTKSTINFITQAQKIHGDLYNYSLVNYKNAGTKVTIICNIHGKFEITPRLHTGSNRKQGCQKCGIISSIIARTKTLEQFIVEATDLHESRYNYEFVVYKNNKTPVYIECDEHGPFKQSPECHLRGQGCPLHFDSKGETKVANVLRKNGIHFTQNKSLPGLCYKKPLRIDFYWEINQEKFAIEFDGRQHFESSDFFGGDKTLKETQKRDTIKNNYCIKNGIKLLRISYKEFYQIKEIVDDFLQGYSISKYII